MLFSSMGNKTSANHIQFHSLKPNRSDRTVMVDWALKINYLSITLKPKQQSVPCGARTPGPVTDSSAPQRWGSDNKNADYQSRQNTCCNTPAIPSARPPPSPLSSYQSARGSEATLSLPAIMACVILSTTDCLASLLSTPVDWLSSKVSPRLQLLRFHRSL